LIDNFEFLLALSCWRHCGRGVEAYGVTQPMLSAGVRSLEDQLGELLMSRGSLAL
jgi:DNA-binding transcriptional LysR family regulator